VDTESPTDPPGNSTPPPFNDYVPKEVSIVLWDLNTESTAKGEWARIRQEKFARQYPEISITRLATPMQAGDAIGDRVAFTTAIASGTAPHAYHGGHFSLMTQWINNDFAYPIDEYVKNWADFSDLTDASMKLARMDGKVYGIPEFLYVLCFAYNKDMYRAAGLDPDRPPETWEELVSNSRKLTTPDKSRYGLSLIGNSFADWWFQMFVWQAGGELSTFDDAGRVSVHYTDPAVKEALQFYYDLRWTHDVLQSDFSIGANDLWRDFTTGKCAQTIYSSHFYEVFVSMGMDEANLGLATLPVGPSGTDVAASGGAYWFVTNQGSDDQKRAAFEYIRFMTSKEAMIELYETMEAYGARSPVFSFYKDIDPSDYISFNRTWTSTFNRALASAREETALVESLRPYINPVIETVLINRNADLDTLLSNAERNAINDVVTPYNRNR